MPGPLLRATAGDVLSVGADNRLSAETGVHWDGIALRNDMDGVSRMTQDPIDVGGPFRYEFTVPDPGTYFYHPHSGVQLDRGSMGGIAGEGMQSAILGGAGDVDYPHYLVNGRTAGAPVTLTGRPRQRVRVRFVNAGSDTAFRVALGGHRMTLTHSDGFPVVPVATDALLIGVGERFDVTVTLADGVFPLVVSAEGKSGQGLALTGPASGPRTATTSTTLRRA